MGEMKTGPSRWPAEILTAAQMRAVEAEAIASGAVTGLDLMERAGQGVVEAVQEEWPDLGPGSRAVVLCGPGNNGGDGFVVARLLRDRGWAVEVFLYGQAQRLPPDARVNCELWGATVTPLTEEAFLDHERPFGAAYADLYVDAIFGAGLSRPLEGEALAVLTHMSGRNGDDCTPRTVAIDAPSGLCLDSGRVLGRGSEEGGAEEAARAALTVTFETAKPGHFLGFGPACCGKLVVKPIGIWPWRRMEEPRESGGHWQGRLKVSRLNLVGLASGSFDHYNPTQPAQVRPGRLDKPAVLGQHKFGHGHALVLSGPSGAGGAARLAARSALRVGAGLVTLACPPEALAENAARLDAVMLKAVAGAEALTALLTDPRITALCLGPGLGLDERASALVRAALEVSRSRRPSRSGLVHRGALSLVLDADALTLISRTPDVFPPLHEGCVLTPHGGEFARLFPDLAERLEGPKFGPLTYADAAGPGGFAAAHARAEAARQALLTEKGPAYSKLDATREAAARAGCTVLFKGPDTVIASPTGPAAIHAALYDRAAPWLATAGSGDVLAGLITGLLARGFSPQNAAETGAWLHVEAARAFGPGLIAEDLPEMIPKVFRALGL